MDLNPNSIIKREISKILELIRQTNLQIVNLIDDTYREALIAKAKGEEYSIEVAKTQIRNLYEERRALREQQRQLSDLNKSPDLMNFAVELRRQVYEIAAAFKEDEGPLRPLK